MSGELHFVRKTVEALCNKGHMEQPEQGKAHVCGVSVEKDMRKDDSGVDEEKTDGQISRYKITLFE